jgi:hypothetical protein
LSREPKLGSGWSVTSLCSDRRDGVVKSTGYVEPLAGDVIGRPGRRPLRPAGKAVAVAPGMPLLSGMELTVDENGLPTKRHPPSFADDTVFEPMPAGGEVYRGVTRLAAFQPEKQRLRL